MEVAEHLACTSRKEFIHKQPRQTGGVVAQHPMLFHEIVGNQADFHFLDVIAIDDNGRGTLRAIAPRHFRRNGFSIGDDSVDYAAAHVFFDGPQMIA